MALKGNLSNFRLGDLLQTLTQNQTWGILRLERRGERRDLVISPFGVAILDLTIVARARVESRLAHRGALDSTGLQYLRTRENSRKPLSELLTQIPTVEPECLRAVLEAEAGEQLQQLLDWADGTFELAEGDAPSEMLSGLKPRDTAGIVFEAARRQDERAAFGDRFPHPEERFRRVEGIDTATLTEDEREFMLALDADVSMRVAADRTFGDFFTAAKTALTLEGKERIHRLDWQQYVDLAESLTAANRSAEASGVLGFLESWETITDAAPWIELAEHRKNLGDDEGAARCFERAAYFYSRTKDPEERDRAREYAADCMAQAVALAPKDVNYRARRVDTVRALENKSAELLYETIRDWLAVSADRGDSSRSEALEHELLTILPPNADEEAKVGRALGQLGRKTAAAQLLCRAAKRRLKTRGEEHISASEFNEALRFVNDYPEARKGLARLDGRKTGRRRATIVLAVGLVGLTSAVAFPIRNSFRDREQSERLTHAERMLDRGDIVAALAYLDAHESQMTSGDLLERCQQLRASASKKSDDRRQREQSEVDDWARDQFSKAADAVDAKDYGAATATYAAILDKGFDESTLSLVAQRLKMIERKLSFEQKRVEDLCRSLSSKTKTALRTAVENSQTALLELETLVSSRRREGLESFLGRLPESSLVKAIQPDELSRLQETIRVANGVFAKGFDLQQSLARQQAESKELNELESFLLTARKSESDGDSSAALEAFRTLGDRYKGTALRKYLDDRVKHWESVSNSLEGYAVALDKGEIEAARAHMDKARALCPNVKVLTTDATFEIDTLPTGAQVFVDGKSVGPAPVKVKFASEKAPRIEARLPGFETKVRAAEVLTSGRTVLSLVPKPDWKFAWESAPSGSGAQGSDSWILADRHGSVRAVSAAGAVLWSQTIPTLSGIAGNPARRGDRVFVVTMEGLLLVLDEASGLEQRRIQLPTAVAGGPVVCPGGVAILGANDVVYSVSAERLEVTRTFSLLTRATTDLAATQDCWFVGTHDGSVLCVEADGNLRWRTLDGPSIDAIRSTASGACLALAGSTLTRLDPATGVATHVQEFKGMALLEDPTADPTHVWIANGSQWRFVNTENLAVEESIVSSVDDARQLVRLTRGFAVANSAGIVVLDSKGKLHWTLESRSKPRAFRAATPWLGIADDAGHVMGFSNLP